MPSTPGDMQHPGVSGTLTGIDGFTLTLTTDQGEVLAYVMTDTFILQTKAATLADLEKNQSLTVIGDQDKSENITATSIMIRLQDQDSQFIPPDGAAPEPGLGQRPDGSALSTTPPGDRTVRGAIGNLSGIYGNTLTLTTMQGEVLVYITSDTTIEKNTVGTITDLYEGLSLTVMGTRDADGNIAATSIMVQSSTISRPIPVVTSGLGSETNAISIGIYADSACTRDVRNIDWGSLQAGTSSIKKKFYIKNLRGQAITLTVSVPADLSGKGISFTNCGPLNLSASSLSPAVWVLTMSLALSNTAEIGEINFKIICTGEGTAATKFTITIPSHVNITAPEK
jgi:hypothetical protein